MPPRRAEQFSAPPLFAGPKRGFKKYLKCSLQAFEFEISVIGAVKRHFGNKAALFNELGKRYAVIGRIMIHIDHFLHAYIVDKNAQIDIDVLCDKSGKRLGRIAEFIGDLF